MTNLTIRNQKKRKQLILPKINQKGNLLIPIALFAFLLIALYMLFTFKNPSEMTNSSPASLPGESTSSAKPDSKTYTSKDLKISIEVPDDFTVDDKFITITLKRNSEAISITKNGTNFDDIETYLKDFDSKRNLKYSEVKKHTVDELNAISRIIVLPDQKNEQKSYYIYKDNKVFIISTSSPSLYPTLDQIAQSFKYIP